MFKIEAAQRMSAGKFMKKSDYAKDIKHIVQKTGCDENEAWEELEAEEGDLAAAISRIRYNKEHNVGKKK